MCSLMLLLLYDAVEKVCKFIYKISQQPLKLADKYLSLSFAPIGFWHQLRVRQEVKLLLCNFVRCVASLSDCKEFSSL